MSPRALFLLTAVMATSAARTASCGGSKSSTTATNTTIVGDSIIVDNNDQGHSTLVLILSVLGGITLTALFLHCCWCCALYCLIGWRTRTLQKQIIARREKMPSDKDIVTKPYGLQACNA
uniref:Uncharacterized protein n=1 Tax=Romanomermis culicivorax TaxID=13658 RepID=A0A915HP27_ROMCU